MKAKNIFTKGFLLASVFALSGCSSFLDEKNWSSQSAEEYYATAEGYESLINGAYSTLKSVYNTTNYFLLTQLGTDLGTQNDGTATNALNQYTVDYTNDNGTVYNQWKVLYESLKNVNAAIGRAAMVVTKDQDIFDGIDKENTIHNTPIYNLFIILTIYTLQSYTFIAYSLFFMSLTD